MMTCTCRKSHPDKHYTFTEVEIDENRSCVHCGFYAVEFPDTADLARPNHYLLGEAGNYFARNCSKCGELTRLEDLVRGKIQGECKDCATFFQREYRVRTGKTLKPNKRLHQHRRG